MAIKASGSVPRAPLLIKKRPNPPRQATGFLPFFTGKRVKIILMGKIPGTIADLTINEALERGLFCAGSASD